MRLVEVSRCLLINDEKSLGENSCAESSFISGHLVAKSSDCRGHVPKVGADVLRYLDAVAGIVDPAVKMPRSPCR